MSSFRDEFLKNKIVTPEHLKELDDEEVSRRARAKAKKDTREGSSGYVKPEWEEAR